MIIQLTQPELTSLDGMISEMVNSKVRQDAEKDLQKEICDRGKDELELPPKVMKALVNERYDNKISNDIEEKTSIVELHEMIEQAARNHQ